MDLQAAIYKYCNYQERCHQEVRDKLYQLGATRDEVEHQIAALIEADLLNEERYARAYARGKFRIKKWGRLSIVRHLKQNRISEYCIKKGLSEIDPEEYDRVLSGLAAKKWHELRNEGQIHVKKGKTYRFLQQKGYESDLIMAAINELLSAE